MRLLEKLGLLTGFERRILIQAAFWMPVTSILLRVFGYRKTKNWFQQDGVVIRGAHDLDSGALELARNIARIVEIAANHSATKPRCLQKSLVLIKLLHKNDISCRLVLGARVQDKYFGAHAWVECGGVVINDTEDVGLRYSDFQPPADRAT